MRRFICCLLFLALWAAPAVVSGQDRAPDGASLYERHCASCHDAGAARAPTREQFRAMSPVRVLSAMERGAMISMATGRTAGERRAIAEFVTGTTFENALSTAPLPQAM